MENDSIATRGSQPSRRSVERADAMAMSASWAAVGLVFTPGSANTTALPSSPTMEGLEYLRSALVVASAAAEAHPA